MADTSIIAGGRAPGNPSIYNPLFRNSTSAPPGTPVGPRTSGTPGVGPAGAGSDDGNSAVVGITMNVGVDGNHVLVQTAGFIELTTDQWDEVTGQSGGLTQGSLYFLGDLGLIQPTPFPGGGNKKVKVGMAMSSTELLVQIGDVTLNT